LPFGASQYINGESGKGLIIGGLQGATLAANLIAGITALSFDLGDGKAGGGSKRDQLQHTGFNVAWVASVAALGGFVVTYVYGVADAWWNRVPEQEVSNTE